ncbi:MULTISPECIES: GNAT family N-acetyltransferase [Mesorhizobium]|uniref:GNAT family N-acetyltransferase n=1 Tax=Mesorhizobium TaxID=68287 RepID=UPI0007A9569F|nr:MULTISPECIES: GNAT family N-acetyltransferase [Mesorhizobium]RUV14429.1 GNAT family N-acetyltransferase [Mesorhizobium sp. M7A.T.Ca.TU.009.01.3.1]RVA56066.1 GNAT family N-acetyltransferase [Mesorhizobium sp. M7A.F.Ca.US.001.01.1.1]WIE92706.1 GNAT family N-acetyltransferase [Mesorhizobium sp. WSM4875]AMX95460.1 hypothetical protein A4R28_21745 [Mesorhizobium ciceri]AZO39953.1 GNAT family N-acetyltransferase [Mesorhizobium sp. M7D.F.Ca.US.005.01.1.1]
MTVSELKERFIQLVNREIWMVDLFSQNGEIVGLATHRLEPDNAEPSGQRVFLRQFYVSCQHRRSEIGCRTLELLIRSRFHNKSRIFLDVLETNPGRKTFWSHTGFVAYSTLMERLVEKADTK